MNEEDYKKDDDGYRSPDIELGPEVQVFLDNIFDAHAERLDKLIAINRDLLQTLKEFREDFCNWRETE